MDDILYGDMSYDELSYIEGQIALKEVNVILEKEEIISKLNLYGEAAGGIILGLLGFLKSAIGLILKIFIGFKGFIIALIVGFVARFIYKKMNGGVDSTGGGGSYTSTSLSKAGVSAAQALPKLKKADLEKIRKDGFLNKTKFMSAFALKELLGEAKLRKLSKIKAPLEVLMTPSTADTQPTDEEIEKAIEEVSDVISDVIAEEIRVNVDNENSSAMVIPNYIDIKKLSSVIEEYTMNDKRPCGGTYSQIFASAPFYMNNVTEESSLMKFYDEKYTSLEHYPTVFIIPDFILNYDSAVAAALSVQIGILNIISNAGGGDDVDECLRLFDELKTSIPSDVLRNIGDLQKSFKEYNGKNPSKYMISLFSKMKHRYKPKSYEDYKNIADVLKSYMDNQKKTKDWISSGLQYVSLYTDDSGTLISSRFSGTSESSNSIGVLTLKELKESISDSNFDINKLKNSLNKLENIGKKVQSAVNAYKTTNDNKNSIDANYSKKAIEFSIAIVSCTASSATILSRYITNDKHPIFKALQEDILAIIQSQVTNPELYTVEVWK